MNERRHASRIRPTATTGVSVGGGRGSLIDLSLGGACVLLDHPLRALSVHELSSPILGNERLRALVRRCRIQGGCRDEDGRQVLRYRLGLSFDLSDDGQRHRLQRLMGAIAPGSEPSRPASSPDPGVAPVAV